jgi:hypothetical protein
MPSYEEKMEKAALQAEEEDNARRRQNSGRSKSTPPEEKRRLVGAKAVIFKPCPVCSRKFNELVFDVHVSTCKFGSGRVFAGAGSGQLSAATAIAVQHQQQQLLLQQQAQQQEQAQQTEMIQQQQQQLMVQAAQQRADVESGGILRMHPQPPTEQRSSRPGSGRKHAERITVNDVRKVLADWCYKKGEWNLAYPSLLSRVDCSLACGPVKEIAKRTMKKLSQLPTERLHPVVRSELVDIVKDTYWHVFIVGESRIIHGRLLMYSTSQDLL